MKKHCHLAAGGAVKTSWFSLMSFLTVQLLALFLLTGEVSAVNSVRVECPILKPEVDGDSIPIKIFITNDVPIVAFTMAFCWDKSQVAITSAKKGADFPAAMLFQKAIRPAERRVLIGGVTLFPDAWMDPSVDAHIATLYLRVPVGTPPMWVDIDTASMPMVGAIRFMPTYGEAILPDYIDCGTQDIRIETGSVCGDVDGTGTINLTDAVYLVRYIFEGGTAPDPVTAGDVDCSGAVDLSDVVYLATYVFGGGAAPCAACK